MLFISSNKQKASKKNVYKTDNLFLPGCLSNNLVYFSDHNHVLANLFSLAEERVMKRPNVQKNQSWSIHIDTNPKWKQVIELMDELHQV